MLANEIPALNPVMFRNPGTVVGRADRRPVFPRAEGLGGGAPLSFRGGVWGALPPQLFGGAWGGFAPPQQKFF